MMEVVESTPFRLVLRTGRRFVVLGSLGAVGSFLLGILIVWVGARVASVTCTRQTDHEVACEAREAVLGLVTRAQRRFDHVRAAAVDEVFGDDGSRYFVELVTADGARRLSDIHSTRLQIAAFARRFNAFVRGAEPQGRFIQEPDLLLLPFIPLMFLVTVVAFRLSRPRGVELDTRHSMLIVREPFKPARVYFLDRTDDLFLAERRRENDSPGRSVVYLRKGNGQKIDLDVQAELLDVMKDYLPKSRA
jgi:hypothetical protein